MDLQSGVRLGPYEIVAPLGASGMGQVYRATDTHLGREVVIKVLPPAHYLARFRSVKMKPRRARACARWERIRAG